MNEAHTRPNREAQSMLMGAPEAETSPVAAEAMAKVCGEERESTRTAATTSDAAVTSAQDPADEPCPRRSPYRVLRRTDKTFTVDAGGSPLTVAINRLRTKPAFLLNDAQNTPLPPGRQVVFQWPLVSLVASREGVM
ncbi:hypothetical protein TTRE_0000700401 [Trichuris trichiura]|uniref:Uncharacterized protein n=1 Tax=Trichuris trichiura TaxID=36087 RepID=A0A077ZFU7_TRITR|nr:hypothetical protein TTRE_0000700401 [Trichuris trichiura]